MNHYELLCIISGKIAETEIAGFEKTIENMLKNAVSTINYAYHLDRKKLAFPIDHHAYGYYFLAEFDAEPQTVSRIERELSLMNQVLRHAVTQKKTVGAPPIMERKQTFDALPSIADIPMDGAPVQHIKTPAASPIPPHVQIVESAPELPIQQPVATPIELVATLEPLPVQAEAPAKHATDAQKDEEPAQQKKKQEKLSYEELDKRLDEIINNDLF